MSTAFAMTTASGITLPKLPPRSSSWRSMPSAAPSQAKVDITSHVVFPSLSSGGSSAKAPMLVSKPAMDFKKAIATKPSVPDPESTPEPAVAVTVAPSRIAVKVYRHPYGEEEDHWPSDEDEEEEGEYNANLMSDRRRGDKGFW